MISSSTIRIAFIGCVQEGLRSLETLLDLDETILGVFTLTPEQAARTSGAVHWEPITSKNGIPLHYVENINDPEPLAVLRAMEPDLIFCVGWTQLLRKAILELPNIGCLGFHASLLPRYRGRAPVNWAIIHGETETGNTLMLLDEGVDTGDILAQRRFPILPEDTCATIYEKVASSEDEMIREIMPKIRAGKMPRRRQDPAQATVMPKRRPRDGIIDWNRTTWELHNWVRAQTHPYPGAFTWLGGTRVRIWKARPGRLSSGAAVLPPGFLRQDPEAGNLLAGTLDGVLILERIQYGNREEMSGEEFSRTHLPEEGAQTGMRES